MGIDKQKMFISMEIEGDPRLYDLRDLFQNLGDDFPTSSRITYLHFSDSDNEGTVCFEYEI